MGEQPSQRRGEAPWWCDSRALRHTVTRIGLDSGRRVDYTLSGTTNLNLQEGNMTSLEALAKLAGEQSHPAWEVALLYPEQGSWTEGAYLRLTNQTNRLV